MPPVVNLAGKHGTVFIHLKNQGHSLRQSDICFTTLNSRALSCPVYGCLTHLLGRNRNLTWILINEHLFIFFLFFFLHSFSSMWSCQYVFTGCMYLSCIKIWLGALPNTLFA